MTLNIILAAGKPNQQNLAIQSNASNSMVPINGKPVISWILNDLLKKRIDQVAIVIRTEDYLLEEFVTRVYGSRLNLLVVKLDQSNSILESLSQSLGQINGAYTSIRIMLGDTLIRDSYSETGDLVYVQKVPDSHRWCIVHTNEQDEVVEYLDKEYHVTPPLKALCGYYQLTNLPHLKSVLHQALAEGDNQLSHLLARYQKKYPIKAIECANWYDFGNIDNLINAKQRLLQSRYFNTLTIDPLLNTITKDSTFDEKLRNELNWYHQLPDRLKILTPRIISQEEKDGRLHLVQEYYGYSTVAELFLYGNLDEEEWESIIRKLLLVHSEFTKWNGQLTENSFRSIYETKTYQRLESLRSNEDWNELLAYDTVLINGQTYKNLSHFTDEIDRRIQNLIQTASSTIIHGDYCFSNILYDLNSQIVRLIDPRGTFGEVGIFGDPRYDMAKLRHSIAGYYDYITSDLFEVEQKKDTFEFDLFVGKNKHHITSLFDQMITDQGYQLSEIRFIETLLFLSMIPYHQDYPKRQYMMYITAIKYLNEIISL